MQPTLEFKTPRWRRAAVCGVVLLWLGACDHTQKSSPVTHQSTQRFSSGWRVRGTDFVRVVKRGLLAHRETPQPGDRVYAFLEGVQFSHPEMKLHFLKPSSMLMVDERALALQKGAAQFRTWGSAELKIYTPFSLLHVKGDALVNVDADALTFQIKYGRVERYSPLKRSMELLPPNVEVQYTIEPISKASLEANMSGLEQAILMHSSTYTMDEQAKALGALERSKRTLEVHVLRQEMEHLMRIYQTQYGENEFLNQKLMHVPATWVRFDSHRNP